jgi:hypothetical protein
MTHFRFLSSSTLKSTLFSSKSYSFVFLQNVFSVIFFRNRSALLHMSCLLHSYESLMRKVFLFHACPNLGAKTVHPHVFLYFFFRSSFFFCAFVCFCCLFFLNCNIFLLWSVLFAIFALI